MAHSAASSDEGRREFERLLAAGERVEWVGGEIVRATPTPEHGAVQMGLGDVLGPFRGGPGRPGGWWLMTEVEVAYSGGETYRHDGLGFRRDGHPMRPSGWPLRVRPDWVCEVLSTSTARYDVVDKLRTLHADAVPHYRLVDPERETLTVLRHAPDAYLALLTAGRGDIVRAEPFEAVEIAVARLLGVE
jgi:Uma2 family endonuclease